MNEVLDVLLVDDDPSIRLILAKELGHCGITVRTAQDVPSARVALAESAPDAVLLDLHMAGIGGAELLREIREAPDAPAVVILTGHAHVELAVQCMKEGASDLLSKPCSVEQIVHALRQAVERERLRDTARTLLTPLPRPGRSGTRLVGASPAMQALRRLIERVAPTSEPVLIVGESGIGKELVAQELQALGPRARKPFLTVNCAAVTDTLLESELFGHEKGAFSGAAERRLGYFELADGGTIFLDEIGDMPHAMQAKLLRVLQSGEVRRVGGTRTMNVDVRVIAATNKPLAEEIAAGRFREDLHHRINTIVIEVPPLRERAGDIGELCQHFLREIVPGVAERPRFSGEAMAALLRYEWPGNVRELRNVVRRAVILREGDVMELESLPPHIRGAGAPVGAATVAQAGGTGDSPQPVGPPGGEPIATLEDVERRHILAVLKAHNGSKTAAARALGISVRTLYNKFEAWGLNDSQQGS